MFAVNKNVITQHPALMGKVREIAVNRALWIDNEKALKATMLRAGGGEGMENFAVNAFDPEKFSWLEIDTAIDRVSAAALVEPFMRDLAPLAKTVHIGKIAVQSRVQGFTRGIVKRSLSGQPAVPLEGGEAVNDMSLVPIFQHGYGAMWRDFMAGQSEGMDIIADDRENGIWNMQEDIADYVLNGDTRLAAGGAVGYGILNSPNTKAINLGSAAGGADIDLTTATSEELESFFSGAWQQFRIANRITENMNFYASPEVVANLNRMSQSLWVSTGGGGYMRGNVADLLGAYGIGKVDQTSKLTGNQFFAFVPSSRYIRPLVGAPIQEHAVPRHMPTANYQFELMAATGIDIRRHSNGLDYGAGVVKSVVAN